MGDQLISRDPTCLRPLKAAALEFFSSACALWLTQCSLLDSGRACNCLACPHGSNGNIPWEKISSGVSWSAVINTLYGKHSNRKLHSGFTKAKRGVWSKAVFNLGFRRGVSSQVLVLLLVRPGIRYKNLWKKASISLRSVQQGYVGAAVRPDLAKAQQHLRQKTNPSLSWSETLPAMYRLCGHPPTTSLLLWSQASVFYARHRKPGHSEHGRIERGFATQKKKNYTARVENEQHPTAKCW